MADIHIRFGQLLRAERERRKLALVDLATELKISETNLEHIENGNLAGLPGELYFSLFGRSYAQQLGIDYTQTIESLKDQLGQSTEVPAAGEQTTSFKPQPIRSEEKPEKVGEPSTKPRPVFVRIGFIVSALLVTAAAVLGWYIFSGDQPIDIEDLSSSVANTVRKIRDTEPTAAPAGTKPLVMKLIAHDRTWAIVLADGDTVLVTNLKPWREYVIDAQERLVVSLGAPLGVDVYVNDRKVDLTDPETGTVANVEISAATLHLYLKEPPDTAGMSQPAEPSSSLVVQKPGIMVGTYSEVTDAPVIAPPKPIDTIAVTVDSAAISKAPPKRRSPQLATDTVGR